MSLSAVRDHTAQPADFGDVRSEFAALLSACGVFDSGNRAKLTVTGGDRMRWLNGMVTNNVRDLAVGHGVYAFLLNPQGHILGDLYAYNRSESVMLDIEDSQLKKLLAHFDHYIIMDDVEVSKVSDKIVAIGIAGPKASEVLRAAGLEIPELEMLQFADISWRGTSVTVVRGDDPAVPFYELWIGPEKSESLREVLVQCGAKPVGTSALEWLRIAAGIPRYSQDIHERDLPQETEQQRALHFSKGCYIGQEIVERIRSRGNVHRKFTGFEVHGPVPQSGAKVQAEDREVGEITSAAMLPAPGGDYSVALGYARREFAMPGKHLQAGNAQLTVVAVPFAKIFPPQP
jgi:folate-binding protein YgfZ